MRCPGQAQPRRFMGPWRGSCDLTEVSEGKSEGTWREGRSQFNGNVCYCWYLVQLQVMRIIYVPYLSQIAEY